MSALFTVVARFSRTEKLSPSSEKLHLPQKIESRKRNVEGDARPGTDR